MRFSSLLIMGSTLAISSSAFAISKEECMQYPLYVSSYNAGYQTGRQTVQLLRSQYGGNLGGLIQAVDSAKPYPGFELSPQNCRMQGQRDGMETEINFIAGSTGIPDGFKQGVKGANGFCNYSPYHSNGGGSGLPRPEEVYEAYRSFSCNSAFDAYVNTYCPAQRYKYPAKFVEYQNVSCQ